MQSIYFHETPSVSIVTLQICYQGHSKRNRDHLRLPLLKSMVKYSKIANLLSGTLKTKT